MTRADILARFPRASEATIRANLGTLIPGKGVILLTDGTPHPAPLPPRTAKAKITASAATPAAKPPKRRRVAKTRNGATLTEAAFWGMVRSGLRRTFRWWKPALSALKAARVPFRGPCGQKWAFLCADCQKLFLRRQVQIDHVVPAGALTDYAHVGEFLRRLTPERSEDFACRCKKCHQKKTNAERGVTAGARPAHSSQSVHFRSASCEWSTPQAFFDKVNAEFGPLELDPCSTRENHKCPRFFTIEDNGLAQDWAPARVWVNPPYGREIGEWMRKAWVESKRGAFVICLVPARTDTAWWHEYVTKGTVRFICGRLKFGGHDNNSPFPNAFVIFEAKNQTNAERAGR